MPRKQPWSDDPDERKRNLVIANEAQEQARNQNAADRHAGRTPTYGEGTMNVLGRRVEDAQDAIDDLDEDGLAEQ